MQAQDGQNIKIIILKSEKKAYLYQGLQLLFNRSALPLCVDLYHELTRPGCNLSLI